MAFQKLLRANVGIWAAYPEAFEDPENPTAAELNDWFEYGTNEDAMVFNISCAILDDYTLNMADSDTDDSMSICDIGTVSVIIRKTLIHCPASAGVCTRGWLRLSSRSRSLTARWTSTSGPPKRWVSSVAWFLSLSSTGCSSRPRKSFSQASLSTLRSMRISS